MHRYKHKNCQSLFGYAANVHIRSGGRCQLCDCGGPPLDFDLWRQMTVEHLVGKSQGGYLIQIRNAVATAFSQFTPEVQEKLSKRIDELNTVTACSFCNSTTSRDKNSKTMLELLLECQGTPEQIVKKIESELQGILRIKRENVQWKLASVREAFANEVLVKIERQDA